MYNQMPNNFIPDMNNFGGNQFFDMFRRYEQRLLNLERDVRRLENKVSRLEQNNTMNPYMGNQGIKYEPNSYNMF